MQTVTEPSIPSEQPIALSQTMYVILYPQSAEQQVVDLLDGAGVSGFTETSKVIGRGPRGHHFDTQIWPGADGMIYTVVDAAQQNLLRPALQNLSRLLEARSQGLYGLHVFTWPCRQEI